MFGDIELRIPKREQNMPHCFNHKYPNIYLPIFVSIFFERFYSSHRTVGGCHDGGSLTLVINKSIKPHDL